MNDLNCILLTIVTHNQTQKTKAEILAEIIQIELGNDWSIKSVDKYYKFENSFKIELQYDISKVQQNEVNNLTLSFTDKIVSPWLVYLDKNENILELIYNEAEHSLIRKAEFNVIKWGHLQIVK